MCHAVYSVLLPKCSVATAVKAMWKCCGTVFGWDSNPHSKSSLLIARVNVMSEIECSYCISQSISYNMSIDNRSECRGLSIYSLCIWKLLVIQASNLGGREI